MERDYKLWESCARIANSLVGKPFRHESDPPESFNCLTLVAYFYQTLGWRIPFEVINEALGCDIAKVPRYWWRDPRQPDYYLNGVKLVAEAMPIEAAYAGDVFLFHLERKDRVTHAGVVLDGCQFVHVLEHEGVCCARLHGIYQDAFAGTYRVKEEYR